MRREWLRRRELFAFGAALRHSALLDRPDRLPRVAVQHEHKALLGRLDHEVALTIASIDPCQGRLRRQIIVPDIVMHGLERPDQFAGLAFERDNRISMFVIAEPLAAPKIRAGRRRRQEYESPLFIHRHRRPDVGLPGVDAVMDQRIKAPARLAAPRIEGAHGAERRIDADIVRYRGADHHDAPAYNRHRGDLEFAGP